MKVLIINGYSASNHGDGLLVDLAVDLIRDAFGTDAEVAAVVRDAESFRGRPYRIISEFRSGGLATLTIAGVLALVTAGRIGFSRDYVRAMNEADLVVSVGGAYLRGGRPSELVKSSIVHASQLRLVGRSGLPWVMLPQGIGPHGPIARRLIRRAIAPAHTIFVRDDKSEAEYGELLQVQRVPDSAILALAGGLTLVPTSSTHRRRPRVGLVLRALNDAPEYETGIRELMELMGEYDVVPLLQSNVGGNDDEKFYERLGLSAGGGLHESLARGELDLVLSVRLHGALEAVLSGVPSVHLSYERKGFSAFADLGLEDKVFDARRFAATEVADAVAGVMADSEGYWAAVRSNIGAIENSRSDVVTALRASVVT